MRRGYTGPRHILVIDDSEVLLSRIKKALVDDGHMVTTTTQTVGNARHLATCDLVIIDYHMPGINGLAVQQAMRAAAAHLDHEPLFYLVYLRSGGRSDVRRPRLRRRFSQRG